MRRQGFYLYCFARPGLLCPINAPGVDGDGRVTALRVEDVAAVYSRLDLDEFERESAERERQAPASVTPHVCRHERVIQEVMGYSPVLPVRFGAVFSSRRALTELLTEKKAEISQFLDKVSDKEELTIKPADRT